MSVKIHGKEYRTVAERVNLFHDENKDAVKSIKTKILFTQEDKVVMRATVTVGDSIYTGHAEEVYGSSRINETSALENCETSAIGRALANLGMSGKRRPSREEMQKVASHEPQPFTNKKEVAWYAVGRLAKTKQGFTRMGEFFEKKVASIHDVSLVDLEKYLEHLKQCEDKSE